MERLKAYLAAPLFSLADRMRNNMLATQLNRLGREVLLPQRRALMFQNPTTKEFSLDKLRADCTKLCADKHVICVACLDGPDADSGTVFEFATALQATGRLIGFRTDFRTCTEREVGINGMLSGPKPAVSLIYLPCHNVSNFEDFGEQLAKMIEAEIQAIEKREATIGTVS